MPKHVYQGGVPRYQDVVNELQQSHGADAVALLIVNGKRGNGFSMTRTAYRDARMARDILRITIACFEQALEDLRAHLAELEQPDN